MRTSTWGTVKLAPDGDLYPGRGAGAAPFATSRRGARRRRQDRKRRHGTGSLGPVANRRGQTLRRALQWCPYAEPAVNKHLWAFRVLVLGMVLGWMAPSAWGQSLADEADAHFRKGTELYDAF